MDSKTVYILLDADVIIHFYKAERLSVLQELYKGRLLIRVIDEYPFPSRDAQILQEYATLSKTKGKGESACMAVCRYQNNILASSNLKDIKPYCEQFGIAYLTTMDILAIAHKKDLMSLKECDDAIRVILAKQSKLPYNNLHDYLTREFKMAKCQY